MKRLLISLFALTFLNISSAMACNIEVKLPSKKAVYKTGDVLVVVIQVTKSHRRCDVDINETTYDPQGLKILSATDWKETSPGVWQRKMKLKVTGNASGKPALYVRRECSKEDSSGSLVLNTKPVR